MLCTKNAFEDHNFNKKVDFGNNLFPCGGDSKLFEIPIPGPRTHIVSQRINFLFVLFWKTKLTCDVVCFYKNSSNFATAGMVDNGSRTEWSPIRSVIIQIISKTGRPRKGCPICLLRV